ncbi:unnamed protein product [Moneuplotes crassus]|uniref:Uncharacterized protein n=1 Tax=Euplotes crassus TaxID=5936 RepID=A0AAD1U4T5_EUPCR|nr:unnamed protein product [Moneuplotes crassus]
MKDKATLYKIKQDLVNKFGEQNINTINRVILDISYQLFDQDIIPYKKIFKMCCEKVQKGCGEISPSPRSSKRAFRKGQKNHNRNNSTNIEKVTDKLQNQMNDRYPSVRNTPQKGKLHDQRSNNKLQKIQAKLRSIEKYPIKDLAGLNMNNLPSLGGVKLQNSTIDIDPRKHQRRKNKSVLTTPLIQNGINNSLIVEKEETLPQRIKVNQSMAERHSPKMQYSTQYPQEIPKRRSKNLSVWDAMLLHDVKNYEKEQDLKKENDKNNQRKLKAFLDQQVNYKMDQSNFERLKEQKEHKSLVSHLSAFDRSQARRQVKLQKRMIDNSNYLLEASKSHEKKALKLNEKKQLERLFILNEIRKVSEEEQQRRIEQYKRENVEKEFLRSTILQKSQEKEMLLNSEKKEATQSMRDQIKQFDDAEKRYKDIFVAIDKKEQKIQQSYQKLQAGCRNLALAEVDKDKSLEDLVKKQNRQATKMREKYEHYLQKKKNKDLSDFKTYNALNLGIKNQKMTKNEFDKATTENYIVMKDMMEKMIRADEERNKKIKMQGELRQTLRKQMVEKKDQNERDFQYLNDKEFGINKQILLKMKRAKDVSLEDQQSLI